jgi:recombinational DNA repair ATPase RecF
MIAMQESHQRARDEYERILKQENELLNQQIKQHLTEKSSNSRKSSVVFFFILFFSLF